MLTRSLQMRIFLRSFFLQTGWNFDKYQNLGLTFVMLPVLNHIYVHDRDALPSVLQRYLENFNTQPMMASFCFGALAKQEELLAQAKNLTTYQARLSDWNNVKCSLSITVASIGDRLFWGTLKPFTLLMALCIWLFVGVNFFEPALSSQVTWWDLCGAPIAVFIVFNTIALFVKWYGISLGYNAGEKECFGLIKFDWNKTIYHAKWLGILFSVGLLLWGIYYFVYDARQLWDLQFFARLVIVGFFVSISLITRDLRIPNMYIYLVSMLAFCVACLF